MLVAVSRVPHRVFKIDDLRSFRDRRAHQRQLSSFRDAPDAKDFLRLKAVVIEIGHEPADRRAPGPCGQNEEWAVRPGQLAREREKRAFFGHLAEILKHGLQHQMPKIGRVVNLGCDTVALGRALQDRSLARAFGQLVDEVLDGRRQHTVKIENC